MSPEPIETKGSTVPTTLSGIQPSGGLHLGNLFGALDNWVLLQDTYTAYYCVVDLHALTVDYAPEQLRHMTLETAVLLLAAGVDPERATLFVQSHVTAHAELAWLLGCVATYGELQRMTQFKDKSGQRDSVSAGLFSYPVLMAADILAYNPDAVPVGDDQRQHLELTREIARRFNARFGEVFIVPEAEIPPVAARVMDLRAPRSKMSKTAASPEGVVFLLDPPDVVARKFSHAVTDSQATVRYDAHEQPGVSNLLSILGAATRRSPEELAEEQAGARYSDLKAAATEAVIERLSPIQQRYAELTQHPDEVQRLLAAGAERASSVAEVVVGAARTAMGLTDRAT